MLEEGVRRGLFRSRLVRPLEPSRGPPGPPSPPPGPLAGPLPGPMPGPSPRRSGRRLLEKLFADGPMVRKDGRGVGFIKVIQEFSQAAWILEKEPAHHRLKSCGLTVEGSLLVPRSPTRPVASPPHQILFTGPEVGLEAFEGCRLGFCPHLGNHLIVQVCRPPGGVAALQPLVEFPHRITQPGQLQDVEFGTGGHGRQGGQPETRASSGIW